MAQSTELNKWKCIINKSLRSCTLLLIFILISTCFGSELDPGIQSSTDSSKDTDYGKIHVRKCCPFGQYFDISRGKCALSPTQWSDSIHKSFRNKLTTNASWIPPAKFCTSGWDHNAPQGKAILTFDSGLVGMPYCSTGQEEDIESVAVEIPEDDWDLHGNMDRKWDWENETNYFFKPGVPMLMEVSPGLPYKETYHNLDQFCVDLTKTHLIVRKCRCSEKQPCFRKCCRSGEHYTWNEKNGTMVLACAPAVGSNASGQWGHSGDPQLPLHSKPGIPLSQNERRGLVPRYVVNLPQCDFQVRMSSGSSEADDHRAFVIDLKGQLHTFNPAKRMWEQHNTDYCLDTPPVNPEDQVCPGEPELAVVCIGDEPPIDFNEGFYYFYVTALVISTILLLLTAIVVSLLIESKNIHSWIRLTYVLSHFTFFFLIGLTHARAIEPDSSGHACKTVGVLVHFTGLTTACWLSVINFDLWWTFKVLKPRQRDRLDFRRFAMYVTFAIGLPLLVISIALGIQSRKPKFVCRATTHVHWPIHPDYGEDRKCALSDEARPVYWFAPLGILLVANLIFFCTTTCRMVGLQRMTRRASIESTNGQTQSRQIFIKIFIVSGVTWWVEIIHLIFNKNDSGAWYWLLLDMIHFAQAFALFVIFVCKREIIRSLQIKYPIILKVIPPVSRLERGGTMSQSTNTNLATSMSFRGAERKLGGRKASTTSTTSNSAAVAMTPIDSPTETFPHKESFEGGSSKSANSPTVTFADDSPLGSEKLNNESGTQYVERRDTVSGGSDEGDMHTVSLVE